MGINKIYKILKRKGIRVNRTQDSVAYKLQDNYFFIMYDKKESMYEIFYCVNLKALQGKRFLHLEGVLNFLHLEEGIKWG